MWTGTSDDIQFTSEPAGATVRVKDQEGTTPCTLKVSKKTKEVTYVYPGFTDQTVTLNRSVNGGMVLMDILFTPGYGVSGILIDAATGAWYKLPPQVHVNFNDLAQVGPGIKSIREAGYQEEEEKKPAKTKHATW